MFIVAGGIAADAKSILNLKKENVSVDSSGPLYNAQFTMVPLQPISNQQCERYCLDVLPQNCLILIIPVCFPAVETRNLLKTKNN